METQVRKAANKVSAKMKKKRLIEMESELLSIETRINDLEWQYEQASPHQDDDDLAELLDQRRRAIDKKKYMITELSKIKIELMEESDD